MNEASSNKFNNGDSGLSSGNNEIFSTKRLRFISAQTQEKKKNTNIQKQTLKSMKYLDQTKSGKAI